MVAAYDHGAAPHSLARVGDDACRNGDEQGSSASHERTGTTSPMDGPDEQPHSREEGPEKLRCPP